MTAIRPFTLTVPDESLDNIRNRITTFPWHTMPNLNGWEAGANKTYMQEFCDYWLNVYDWRAAEARINRFSHFKADVEGVDLHFIHEKGSGTNPQPLLISHGWPGSVVEFDEIIEQLAHPERFGGNVEDAFDVIAPSLPGFGFSGPPPKPWGPRAIAKCFNTLMTDVLGYENYIAQGGDWGGAISSWIGYDHAPVCSAIHINILTMRHPDGPQNAEEQAWADGFNSEQVMQDGYRTQQATKPQTLGYGMMDSPVGVAAWITEKFYHWSDLRDKTMDEAHSKDAMLDNIMVYLVTGTFTTSTWIYYGRREEGGRLLSPEGLRVEVPCGMAVFPEEMLAWPPRSYVDRIYNVQHWTEMPRGGHFGAMEEPELMIADIRKFARSLR
jgi:pimeloyl-ACP methyl ester carboxylesterase